MPQCDLCGKEQDYLSKAIVEGSMMSVCNGCARFGNVVEVGKPETKARTRIQVRLPVDEEVETIVSDYGSIVKKARESRDMKQEELAKRIAEKESVIHKIESGHIEPPIELAKKLEQLLRIKLVAVENVRHETKSVDLGSSDMTIGDLISIKKKSAK
ncbi:MAG: multiprotein bridging factor aMBF1 [Candidatus Woesearchaeota archaeon]